MWQSLPKRLASDPKWKNRKSDIFDTVKFGSGHIEQSCSSTFQKQHVSTLFWSSCSVVRYIDTSTISFSLHRKDHLQTSVFQVFTDLDFSGSPVELEFVFPCILTVHRAQKSCSFNSILVVTNPNFFAWISSAVCTDRISIFRHWQCLALAIYPLCMLVPHWFGFCVRLRSAGVGSQTSLTLSNLAMATTNGRGAVRFKFWLNLV